MNMCMLSVCVPSCVNPAAHDARETAGASLLVGLYVLFIVLHLSVSHANVPVLLQPGVVCIGYFYRFCLSAAVSLVIYGVRVS